MFFKKTTKSEIPWIIEKRQTVALHSDREIVVYRIKSGKPLKYAIAGSATLQGRINDDPELG